MIETNQNNTESTTTTQVEDPVTPVEKQVKDKIIKLEAELEVVKIQNTNLTDELLRAKAEVQNIRRRSEEEITKIKKFGVENLAESLLPVLDSLEAALALPESSSEQLLEGSKLTLSQLKQALERNKIVEIAPQTGEIFNPQNQQAISTIESEQDANTIVSLLQKGYMIAERVLRPALVIVAAEKKD